jgi:SAM-dependent methyltransferase
MEQQTLSGASIKKKKLIKSISYDQDEILSWIIELYCPDGFDLDPTYGKGNFYKNIPEPRLKFDVNPGNIPGVKQADCTKLPLEDKSLNSIMFDPPFIAAIPKEKATGIISTRFGYYRNVQTELWGMYHKALKEFYRILKPNGVLVFKCQDTIDAGKQYLSPVEIINCAINLGFYPKDLFILLARNRIIGKTHHKQQHARKFHSYFIVFINEKSKVRYTLRGGNKGVPRCVRS